MGESKGAAPFCRARAEISFKPLPTELDEETTCGQQASNRLLGVERVNLFRAAVSRYPVVLGRALLPRKF